MKQDRIKGVFILCIIIVRIWSLMGYALPLLTKSFDATQHLANYIDQEQIETGQFYYTGVELTGKAEAGARASIAFTEMRKAALENIPAEDTTVEDCSENAHPNGVNKPQFKE